MLGGEDFGYARYENGYVKFPHQGGVVIEDDFEIGNNVRVDRGVPADTIIREGTKFDYLGQIAQDVKISENCLIVANVGICGSVKIGDNCYIGFGATIKNGLKIGNNVFVKMGSVVLKDIPDNKT